MFYLIVLLLIPVNIYRLPIRLPFDLEPQRLLLFLIFGAWVVFILVDPEVRFRKTPVDKTLLLLLGVSFISLVVNAGNFEPVEEFSQAVKAMIYLISFVLLFYFIISVLRSVEDIEKVLKAIVIVGVILSVFGIFERLTSFNIFRHLHQIIPLLEPQKLDPGRLVRGGVRISGAAEHPIAFGAVLTLIAPLAMYFVATANKSLTRFIYSNSFALIVIATLITVSRTALLGLVAEVIILALVQTKTINRVRIILLSVLTLFIVHLAFPGVLGAFRATLTPSYFQQSEIDNKHGRYADYPKIAEEFSNHPLIGRGFGTFDPKRFFYVDNQYLKLLVEIGSAGLMLTLLLFTQLMHRFWVTMKRCDGRSRSLLTSITASILAFTIMSATYDTFGFPQGVYLFFALAAFGMAIVLNVTEEKLKQSSIKEIVV